MSSGSSKKHKRSGSVVVPHSAPAGSVKRKNYPPAHGKFQVRVKMPKERKNLDLVNSLTSLTTPTLATPLLLNSYTGGSNANQALGRRVINKSILIRATVCSDGTGLAANGVAYAVTCRFLVVYDRQPSAAAPTVATILQDLTAIGSSVMNLQNADRFSVLMDEKFPLGGITTGATAGVPICYADPSCHVVDRYVKVGLPTVANGPAFTGAVAGISEGAIWLLAFNDIAAGAGIGPKIVSMSTRVRFIDE